CEAEIPFRVGHTAAIRQHTERHHHEQLQARVPDNAIANIVQDENGNHKRRKVAGAQQQETDKILDRWIARSGRPLVLVEDSGFREYIVYITRNGANIELTVPRRQQLRELVAVSASEARVALKKKLQSDTELLTPYYLDAEFRAFGWTLEVKRFRGVHIADEIASEVTKSLERWELRIDDCALLVRDGAANAVAASKRLSVAHISCIAHSFHLVSGGAIFDRRGTADAVSAEGAGTSLGGREEQVSAEDIVAAFDHVNDFVERAAEPTARRALDWIRAVVSRFRRQRCREYAGRNPRRLPNALE
ncbi:hypothetical protein PybrP1_004072, partial [[Pythium] brassicae (nom. inval.)]